jgi:GAF domain-containing protein
VSEELDHSLQQAIETFLNDRLRSIDEQLARLQAEMSDGLTRLREQSATQSLDGTALSAAVFAHLQTARSERLTAGPTLTVTSPDAGNLKKGVQEIEAQQSQADVLKSLLRAAVNFADRVALFVIKNDQAIGWRLAKVDDPDLEMIGGVSLPLSAQTIVTRAVRDRVTATGANAADSDYAMLLDQLGGAPAAVTSIPLIVRGKIVAVLYADSASSDANAMNVDALELLARVASMAVNLVSIQRAAGVPTAAETTQAAEPAATDEPQTYTPQVDTSESVAEEPQAEFTPALESTEEAAPSFTEEPAPAETFEAPAEPAVSHEPVEAAPTFRQDVISQQVWSPEPQAPPVSEQVEPETTESEVSAPIESAPPPTAPAESVYTSQYSAPLGSRRYGVSEPELPVDVSEDERRLHNDARRFARLLVSEIKLYNEPKVQEGRNKNDLYERLRDDIDRSRQMYDKRVAPPVAARHDYFHQELVNTLAEGDVTKLGMSYPGASVAA